MSDQDKSDEKKIANLLGPDVNAQVYLGFQQAMMQTAIFALIRTHPDPKALKDDWLHHTSKNLGWWASTAISFDAPGHGSKEMQLARGQWEGMFSAAIANHNRCD